MLLLRLMIMKIGNDNSRRSRRPLAQCSVPHVMTRIAATQVRALVALTSRRCPAYIPGMAPKSDSAKRQKVQPSASASDGKEATEIRSACDASAKADAKVPVQVPAVDMSSPPCFDASGNAQGPPMTPSIPQSRTDAAVKVRPLMRSIIAYVRFRLKQTMKENNQFSAFPNVQLHDHPLFASETLQGAI